MGDHAALVRATVHDVLVGGAMLDLNRELALIDTELGPIQQMEHMGTSAMPARSADADLDADRSRLRKRQPTLPLDVCGVVGRYMGTGGEHQMLPEGGNPAYVFEGHMQGPARKRLRFKQPDPLGDANVGPPLPAPDPPAEVPEPPKPAGEAAENPGWLPRIRMRMAADMNLSELSEQTNVDLSNENDFHMDCDKIIMQITPNCLPTFAKYWEVGGSSFRGNDDHGFPDGLEIVGRLPWTLRVKCRGYQILDADHLAVLRDWGAAICLNLRTQGNKHGNQHCHK